MLVKALLVGLVLGFCKSEWMYGFPMTGRPIVVSTLTGLVLGDPVQGVILQCRDQSSAWRQWSCR